MSRRPSKDTEEMDLEMISRWNKKLTSNDLVFHLGDFGDTSVLDKLNFNKMFSLKGNYERKDTTFSIDDSRVEVTDALSSDPDNENIVWACMSQSVTKLVISFCPDIYMKKTK